MAAFEAMYRQHFAFVWRILGNQGVPESEREDVAQEVFLVVHRRWQEWRRDGSVRSWLFGIARRVASDHRRRLARAERRHAALGVVAASHSPRAVDELLARERAKRALARAIDDLEAGRREVFVLMEIESMSAPEVAEALGIPLNTVYSRLRLARRDIMATSAKIQAQLLRDREARA